MARKTLSDYLVDTNVVSMAQKLGKGMHEILGIPFSCHPFYSVQTRKEIHSKKGASSRERREYKKPLASMTEIRLDARATVEDIQRVKDAFLSNCKRIGMVEISDDVIREAQDLVFRIRIKTLDAIHLASSILLRRITELSFPLITADGKLATAAESQGFDVIGVGI
ncbi:hypothetical protein HKBW3S06_00276 [Candidatus Hakubella thermalkaliphila]|uniref:PIN domain-containing protein n=1 Tax=Candidatus Hakubella thermalkaliphila TaxID=2754717 RepID=A0A6V8NP02_9ACTN|nr:type II toxin-antitoxin system VapC family toxin [Candidatus Hakubella thermalkaliphila]GFP21050.1 hypothetical protein HKBW3S06_00276 [Candidatus Hakubella thermalkaliphila]GFP42090.1 hypothetical protein HKBW3C_01216 [Candidatus Hakubella thermalkaliphila]